MTGISTLGAALDQIERIKQQQSLFTTLSVQMTSGKKSQNFAGLGIDNLISTRSRASTKAIDAYISNIDHANRRLSLTTNAVTEFKKQSKIFLDAMAGLGQESVHQKGEPIYYDDPLTEEVENVYVGQTSGDPDVDMRSMQDLAKKMFSTLTDILNTREGDRYLLSGSETTSKPFENGSTMESAMNVLLSGWKGGAIDTDALINDLQDRTTSGGNANALTDSIVGYSSSLSAGNSGSVFVRVSETNEIDYTALGNEQAFRDILVAVSYISNQNLGPIVDVYESPNTYPGVPDQDGAPGADAAEQQENFYKVFNKLIDMVSNAIDDIDSISYRLTNAQARIQQIKLDYTEEKNLLKSTISDVEDVDTNEVAVRLSTLKTQLEVSFQVTAITQQLTLANYLGFS